ncbi:hypothetical protein V8G54_001443 [Vigna mungo]|uniref:Uncharacterized protein n=1 Tax=Vigna mungo TaxID=3915 RepID=A0AAQ3S884_VIGMU
MKKKKEAEKRVAEWKQFWEKMEAEGFWRIPSESNWSEEWFVRMKKKKEAEKRIAEWKQFWENMEAASDQAELEESWEEWFDRMKKKKEAEKRVAEWKQFWEKMKAEGF